MTNVTVIIPIYGVEKYIEQCVRSLFEQTLHGIEYIFVDDCTVDRSMEILNLLIEEYGQRLKNEDKTVIILKQAHNTGLPQARWRGIVEASGEYIIHCDSDDWVDKDMYRLLYEKAVESDSDMVVCDYSSFDGKSYKPHKAFRDGLNRDSVYRLLFSNKIPWVVWNKMIRARFYKEPGMFIPTKTHGEDMAFVLQLLNKMKTFSYINKPLYYYRRGSDTITHSQDIESVLKRFEAVVDNTQKVDLFLRSRENSEMIENGLISIKLINRNKLISLLKDDYYYNMWINTFPEINNKIYNNRHILLKHKIKYFLVKNRIIQFKR